MSSLKTNTSCRFLSSALSLVESLPKLLVILQEDERLQELYESTGPCAKKSKTTTPVIISSEKDQGIELSSSSRELKRKMKKQIKKQRNITKVWCCTHLPKQEPSMDTILSDMNEGFPKKEIFIKPLLVLDINGILCHRIRESQLPHAISRILNQQKLNAQEIHYTSMYRPAIGHVANTHIVSRTDLKSFLNVLNDHFTLALWSSAKLKTIKLIVDMLFPLNVKDNLLFVWGQERCDCIHESDIPTSHHETDNNIHRKKHFEGKVFLKNLGKVFAEYPLFNATNTLLIDDNPTKCPKFIANCIHPSPIMGLDLNILSQQIGKEEFQNTGMEAYNDELNEGNQRIFFEKLIEFWKKPIRCNDPASRQYYMASDILVEHADQMGWRGKRTDTNST